MPILCCFHIFFTCYNILLKVIIPVPSSSWRYFVDFTTSQQMFFYPNYQASYLQGIMAESREWNMVVSLLMKVSQLLQDSKGSFISSYFILFHYLSLCFIIFHYVSWYFVIFHHISSYFIILHPYENSFQIGRYGILKWGTPKSSSD